MAKTANAPIREKKGVIARFQPLVLRGLKSTMAALRSNWIAIVLFIIATLIFFGPIVVRASSYSPGGDQMFNAWTLARDHNCILMNGCPNYADGNIYFPNKNTMLYSETQLSAGLVTLPLHFISQNPLFAYNIWTIVSFFFAGYFMYLLAMRISSRQRIISIASGLIFEFAPFKMAAVGHLQNLSIFCLPLALYFILGFLDRRKRRYLVGLFFVLLYQFYASWYQMVFAAVGVGIILLGFLLLKRAKLREVLIIGAVVIAAVVATLPLATQYIEFSKSNKATFGIADQALYSSSVKDYFTPDNGTILGKVIYGGDKTKGLPYNIDSSSYSGISLYIIGLIAIVIAWKRRKRDDATKLQFKEIVTYGFMAVVGVVVSLGPLLKIAGDITYRVQSVGVPLVVPMPYLLVDKFLPQLSFIRAIGRISVLLLLALCCLLVYLFMQLQDSNYKTRTKKILGGVVLLLVAVDILPVHQVQMANNPYAYNLKVPGVYQYIKDHKQVDDLIVLQARNYPNVKTEFARPEVTLWSGYHNKNIFNGYSGYTPTSYFEDYSDYVNFESDDIPKLQKVGVRYIVLDKLLMQSKPENTQNVYELNTKRYEDARYALFELGVKQ